MPQLRFYKGYKVVYKDWNNTRRSAAAVKRKHQWKTTERIRGHAKGLKCQLKMVHAQQSWKQHNKCCLEFVSEALTLSSFYRLPVLIFVLFLMTISVNFDNPCSRFITSALQACRQNQTVLKLEFTSGPDTILSGDKSHLSGLVKYFL